MSLRNFRGTTAVLLFGLVQGCSGEKQAVPPPDAQQLQARQKIKDDDPNRKNLDQVAQLANGADPARKPGADDAIASSRLKPGAIGVSAEARPSKDPEVLTNMGISALKNGDLIAAERSLRDALRIDPTYPPPFIQLAQLLSRQGRDDESKKLLALVMHAQPDKLEITALPTPPQPSEGRFMALPKSTPEVIDPAVVARSGPQKPQSVFDPPVSRPRASPVSPPEAKQSADVFDPPPIRSGPAPVPPLAVKHGAEAAEEASNDKPVPPSFAPSATEDLRGSLARLPIGPSSLHTALARLRAPEEESDAEDDLPRAEDAVAPAPSVAPEPAHGKAPAAPTASTSPEKPETPSIDPRSENSVALPDIDHALVPSPPLVKPEAPSVAPSPVVRQTPLPVEPTPLREPAPTPSAPSGRPAVIPVVEPPPPVPPSPAPAPPAPAVPQRVAPMAPTLVPTAIVPIPLVAGEPVLPPAPRVVAIEPPVPAPIVSTLSNPRPAPVAQGPDLPPAPTVVVYTEPDLPPARARAVGSPQPSLPVAAPLTVLPPAPLRLPIASTPLPSAPQAPSTIIQTNASVPAPQPPRSQWVEYDLQPMQPRPAVTQPQAAPRIQVTITDVKAE